MHDTDVRVLLARIRTGDATAAEELVRRYESAIRVAVRARLTDPVLRRQIDSMDVCQSVLASFFARTAVGQYDLQEPAQLVALLVKMARNKLAAQARFHRSERRDGRRTAPLDDKELAVAACQGPITLAVARDLLAAARAKLTDAEREVADRRAMGHGWGEIAAELGGTADQVRMRFKRAVDRVAAELGLSAGD